MFYKFICYILVKKHQYIAFKTLQLNSLLPESRVPGDTGVPGEFNLSGRLRVHLHHLTPRGAQGLLVYPALQEAVSAPLLQVRP